MGPVKRGAIRLARLAAVITAVLGIAVGVYILFGPTYTSCSITAIPLTAPGQPAPSPAPQICKTQSLIEIQPIWPLPLLALAAWSLAPLIAVAGVWSGRRSLVIVAVIIEATAVISFGAGPYYVPFVFVPLLLTWALARRAARAA